MTYSNAFKNIDRRTIEATKKLIKDGIWKKDTPIEKKVEICEQWIKTASVIYNVKAPIFEFVDSETSYRRTGGGVYSPSENKITLYKKIVL